MTYPGPIFSGISYGYDVLDGGAYALFADAGLSDASSQQVTLTVTLSNTGVGSLVDPNLATDGGQYDAGAGTYTIAGTPAQTSAALDGLEFVAASNPSSDFATLSVAALDGVGNLGGPGIALSLIAATTYTGGGQLISLPNSGSPVGLILADTGSDADTVSYGAAGDTEYAVVQLDSARAILDAPAILYLSGDEAFDAATLTSNQEDTAYGDGGQYTLAGASLTLVGDDANVSFSAATTANEVSFWGSPARNDTETATGSNGTVIENNVDVTLTGDSDTVYFATSNDALTLTAATPGAWNTLYATSGVASLAGASLSVVGGGVTIDAVSGDDAVSLYQTDGVADTVHGDEVSVTLNNSQAVVDGSGDSVWFSGGLDSTVNLNTAASLATNVYGAGTVNLYGGVVSGVGGGLVVNFLASGDIASLSFTEGVWDRVEGMAGTVVLHGAQATVYGGNQTVDFAGGDDSAASLAQTGGNWDAVSGSAATLIVTSGQVNIYADIQNIFVSGAGSELSVYEPYYSNIYSDDATIIFNTTNGQGIVGGGNILYLYQTLSVGYGPFLINTDGRWDTVYAQDQTMALDKAQSSVVGGGNAIYTEGASAASLYETAGFDDFVYAGDAAVTLNDSGAYVSGSDNDVYFGGGANLLNIHADHTGDLLSFTGSFGRDTITGYVVSDTIQLSKAQFADFAAFQAAFAQQGDDAVLTLDANDKVTFVGLQTSAVTAAQVKFV